MNRPQPDTGSASVEFALVLPLLMLLVFGIIEFGRAYNQQIMLTGAAREGARSFALKIADPPGDVLSTAQKRTIAAGPLAPKLMASQISVCTGPVGGTCTAATTCTANLAATVTASMPFSINIPLGPSMTIPLSGKGVMRCGG